MKLSLFYLILPFIIFSQNLVSYSDSPLATGMSNGAKIALRNFFSDTIHCVFQKSDGIYYAKSVNQGVNWTTQFLFPGRNPSLFVSQDGYRHVVWERDTAGNSEIYYYCLDIRSPPTNISQTPGKSYLPSLAVDTSNYPDGIHIVWADSSFGSSRIYYRRFGGDTFQITNFHPNQDHSYPTIGIFENQRVYVFWQSYYPMHPFPYRIYTRYLERGIWREPIVIESLVGALYHPSCDFSGGENFSLGYERHYPGVPDCRFVGGNGGGYPTPGSSTYPVLSTIGTIWSYLAWMENDSDIYLHFYYFMSGWAEDNLRRRLHIQESVRYPSLWGCNLLWTQGDESPYKVMHYYFGYPIGIEERLKTYHSKKETSQFLINSHPFRFSYSQPFKATIYDIKGRKVGEFSSSKGELIWDGRDKRGLPLKTGIYFIHLQGKELKRTIKLTIVKD